MIRSQLKRCKAIAQQQGDDTTLAHCVMLQAWYETVGPRVDRDKVFKQYQEAIARFRALGDDYQVARTLKMIGAQWVAMGAEPDDPVVLETIEEWLSVTRAIGDRIGIADALHIAAIKCRQPQGVTPKAQRGLLKPVRFVKRWVICMGL